MKDKLYFYLICGVAVTLLTPMILNNIVIFLLALISISRLFYCYKKFNSVQIIFISLFLVCILSIFYSTDKYDSLKSIEKYLSFLIFPIIFSTSNLTKKQFEKILLIFSFSTLITLSIAFIKSLFKIYSHGSIYIFNPNNLVNENLMRYHRLSENVGFHPTYLSIYTAFSMFVLISLFLKYYKVMSSKTKFLFLSSIFSFLIFIFALNTFAVLLSIFLLFFLVTLFFTRGYKFIILLASAFICVLLVFHEKTRNNLDFDKIVSYNYNEPVISTKWNSVNSRLAKWNCAFEAIEEVMPFGTGKGNGREVLIEKYKEKGFVLGLKNQYTSHNMYLTFALELGVLGVCSFLILLIYMYQISLKYGSLIFLSLAILLTVTSITEEVLELNKGIVFFSFFSVIISISPRFSSLYEK